MTDHAEDLRHAAELLKHEKEWVRDRIPALLAAADRIEELERAFNATDIMISQFLAVPSEMERLHARIEELEAALRAAEEELEDYQEMLASFEPGGDEDDIEDGAS